MNEELYYTVCKTLICEVMLFLIMFLYGNNRGKCPQLPEYVQLPVGSPNINSCVKIAKSDRLSSTEISNTVSIFLAFWMWVQFMCLVN